MASDGIDDLLEIDLSKVNTVIDQGVEFHGDLISKDRAKTVLISGLVRGTVRAAGPVVITETGEVVGSIRAPRVKMAGHVNRRDEQDGVVVDGALTLSSKARLECNAVYQSLDTERGAVLAGIVGPVDDEFIREQVTKGALGFIKNLKPVDTTIPGDDDRKGDEDSTVIHLGKHLSQG